MPTTITTPRYAQTRLRHLARDTGFTLSALVHFGVRPSESAKQATSRIRAAVGERAYTRALSAGSAVAISAALMRAASHPYGPDSPDDEGQPKKRRKRKAPKGEPQHTAADEPDPDEDELCASCEHERGDHPRGRRCQVEGCECRRFRASSSDDDEPEGEEPETPEERAMVDRVMQRTTANVTRAQALAAYRAQFSESDRPKSAKRRKPQAGRVVDTMMQRRGILHPEAAAAERRKLTRAATTAFEATKGDA